jgi:hypothetical protein
MDKLTQALNSAALVISLQHFSETMDYIKLQKIDNNSFYIMATNGVIAFFTKIEDIEIQEDFYIKPLFKKAKNIKIENNELIFDGLSQKMITTQQFKDNVAGLSYPDCQKIIPKEFSNETQGGVIGLEPLIILDKIAKIYNLKNSNYLHFFTNGAGAWCVKINNDAFCLCMPLKKDIKKTLPTLLTELRNN